MSDLSPTQDPRIHESSWFVNANQPLIENKVFYSKVDNLIFYITAHRGPSIDNLPASPDEVASYELSDQEGMKDTSADCFNALIRFLDKKN